MPNVTLVFPHDINVSVQVGDIAYYVDTNPHPAATPGINGNWASTTTPHWTADRTDVIMIGPIITIIPWDGSTTTIIADMTSALAAQHGPPSVDDFIMFSKDNKVNLSSLLGYYSLIKLRNNSTEKGEIFSVAADFFESSK